jgi:SMC interacting uncharacterized protein involved in chromosome segregation
MKTLKFKNPKAVELIEQKGVLIKEGRKASAQIEKLDREIEGFNAEERKYTEAVEPKDLIAQGEAIIAEITKLEEKLGPIADEIEKLKLAGIPDKVLKRHHDIRAQKEELERTRNKAALKVQKIKDRLIPIIRKLVMPHLEEFEDVETADAEKGEVVIKVFSHLEDWKTKFFARRAKPAELEAEKPTEVEPAKE